MTGQRIDALQREQMKEYQRDLADYQQDMIEYETLKKLARKGGGSPGKPPEKPTCKRCVVSDITIEAMALRLLENPRGLLQKCGELGTWFQSLTAYKSNGGSDASKWLDIHGGRGILVDRKMAVPPVIYVPRANVSIVGTIQPAILRRLLNDEAFESGLASRFLMCCPPEGDPKTWHTEGINPMLKRQLLEAYKILYTCQSMGAEQGDATPVPVHLSSGAEMLFAEFYNAHNCEQTGMDDRLVAAWAKLQGGCARLALVIHLIRWAIQDLSLGDPDVIDETSMFSGILLTEWFKNETRRIYAMFTDTPDQRRLRNLLDWIIKQAKNVTPRDVQHGVRAYRGDTDAADRDQTQLVKAGQGEWIDIPSSSRGGRPTRSFRAISQ